MEDIDNKKIKVKEQILDINNPKDWAGDTIEELLVEVKEIFPEAEIKVKHNFYSNYNKEYIDCKYFVIGKRNNNYVIGQLESESDLSENNHYFVYSIIGINLKDKKSVSTVIKSIAECKE